VKSRLPIFLSIAFFLSLLFPAMGEMMRAHAHEFTGTIYVQDRNASSHLHEFDVPSNLEKKQTAEAAEGSEQCPDGHASAQACCGALCQIASMPSVFDRLDAELNSSRLIVMVVAPAVKQRTTFIERPPKSIDPTFG
jgi:hypothetical protein